MNIDMRNISPEMERAINKIMEMHSYNAATKAITRAVIDYETLKKEINLLSERNNLLRNELYDEKKKTEKTIKYLKFFSDLIKEDT